MSYVYLVGTGCKQICGYVPRRRKKVTTRRTKPAHLKYVRYHPSAIVTPGWDGNDQPAVIPRIPAYWSYAGAIARRNARLSGLPANRTQSVAVAVVPTTRKRKRAG